MSAPTTRAPRADPEPGPAPGPDPGLGLYLHVPFCERVCPYCDFAVVRTRKAGVDADAERDYCDALLAELDIHLRDPRRAPLLAGRRLASVYFGGGTPGLLRSASFEGLLRGIEARLGPLPEEVCVELNPDAVGPARAAELCALGVTRASIGLQSTHDVTLRRLGRAQRGADALRGLERCLAAGFALLSVDLIHAAPGQSDGEVDRDLAHVLDLGIGHVSAYALTIEPGTPFARGHAAGRLDLPDEDRAWRLGRQVRATLQAAGLRQYEISSFARSGQHSRHNERYWKREDVLGLGMSAASLLGDQRFQNPRSHATWREAVARGCDPAAKDAEYLDDDAALREAVYLGLRRLVGVSRRDLCRRYGRPPEAVAGAELGALRADGLLRLAGDYIRLTERGLDFADEVFARLLPG